jgi:hypothetical protein
VKIVRAASIGFAVASAVFWMLASTVQYQGFQPIYNVPWEPAAWIIAVVGVLPMALYALICLFFFRWLQRKLVRLAKSELEKRDD